MKKILIVLLGMFLVLGAEQQAAIGAVVEGVFIIQNNHQEVKKAIQTLKKELTACFSQKENKRELESYHCKLQQLIYPHYIDELSRLIEQAEKQLLVLDKESVSKELLDTQVQQSFNIVDKIKKERELIAALFKVDRAVKQLESLKKSQDPRVKEPLKLSEITQVQEAIKKGKQAVAELKRSVQQLNNSLFSNLTQEVFIEKLDYYVT